MILSFLKEYSLTYSLSKMSGFHQVFRQDVQPKKPLSTILQSGPINCDFPSIFGFESHATPMPEECCQIAFILQMQTAPSVPLLSRNQPLTRL